MVLNPECVRDVLLAVESCAFGEHLNLDKLCKKLPQHNQDDLHYTVLKLDESGYLEVMALPVPGETMLGINKIKDLTYDGHEFLNTIRSDKVWTKTKETAKKAGVFSLKALMEIATAVAATLINKSLQGGS